MLTHVLSNGDLLGIVLAAVANGEERRDGRKEGGLQDRTTHFFIVSVTQDWVAAGETLEELV